MYTRQSPALPLALVIGLSLICGQTAASPGAEFLGDILAEVGTVHGLCCVINDGERDFPFEIVRASSFLVHVLEPDGAAVTDLRSRARKEKLQLDRFVAERYSPARLPYTDSTVDVILGIDLSKKTLNELSVDELLSVLRPDGKAIIGVSAQAGGGVSPSELVSWYRNLGRGRATLRRSRSGVWVEITKPLAAGVDDWSHWEHGPDNNPVSKDSVIRAPYMTQFMAMPYYIAMPAITTASGGRIFVAMGHIAHHEREEPWLNTLLARNGYNGAELWRRGLPDGYLVHRSAFIATPATFYMIDVDGAGCLLLDPETGEQRGTIDLPEVRGEWKWTALEGDTLFFVAGEEKDPRETTIVRSKGGHWSWFELSRGYYQPRIPWGFGETIGAYSLRRNRLLWTHREGSPVDSRAMAVGDGNVFFYCPDSRVGCLDARSGTIVWTNDDPELRALIEEPGQGLGSTPGFRTTCLCVYTPKGLLYQGQTRMNLVAVSRDDGTLMWYRKKTTNNPNVVYLEDDGRESGTILAGIGPEGSTLVLDAATGETIEDLGFKKRSCVRLTATPDSVFCRGWPEGVTRYDRQTKKITFDGSMRPACNDGVIGANGLLYIGPWLCDCNLSLMGTVALSGAQDVKATPLAERLDVVAGDPMSVAPLTGSPNDWPTYRKNNARAAASDAAVSTSLSVLWTSRPECEFTPTAPTAAGDLVFIGGSDGTVRAINAKTGEQTWTFATAGPILQPPTIWDGRAYVGCGDGCVYALEAATGRLLWRFRAAPVERRIMVYGHLCSTWPVNSGVLIEDGVAYFAAGIIDYDGTYVYALDGRSGALKWANSSTGHLDRSLRKGVSAQGNLTILDGKLWMGGGNVISPAPFDLATGEYLGPMPDDGSPRSNRGEEIGVIWDKYLMVGGRLRYSAIENVVNPGQFVLSVDDKPVPFAQGRTTPAWDDECFVFVPGREQVPVCYARPASEQGELPTKPLWSAEALTGSKTVALALARNAVVALFEPAEQPYNTVHARWNMGLLNRDDGSLTGKQELPKPPWPERFQGATIALFPLPESPLPNGLAIDRDGRVIVAMATGTVVCYGGESGE